MLSESQGCSGGATPAWAVGAYFSGELCGQRLQCQVKKMLTVQCYQSELNYCLTSAVGLVTYSPFCPAVFVHSYSGAGMANLQRIPQVAREPLSVAHGGSWRTQGKPAADWGWSRKQSSRLGRGSMWGGCRVLPAKKSGPCCSGWFQAFCFFPLC